MNVRVEVIGVSPPCQRCKKTEENARKAAAKLATEGIKVEVAKLDVTAKETISKYIQVRRVDVTCHCNKRQGKDHGPSPRRWRH